MVVLPAPRFILPMEALPPVTSIVPPLICNFSNVASPPATATVPPASTVALETVNEPEFTASVPESPTVTALESLPSLLTEPSLPRARVPLLSILTLPPSSAKSMTSFKLPCSSVPPTSVTVAPSASPPIVTDFTPESTLMLETPKELPMLASAPWFLSIETSTWLSVTPS